MPAAADRILSIVIPALNEEAGIEAIVRRCLDTRALLRQRCGLTAVEVLVVNDGSSDRTETLALQFPDVTVLGFDRNRGYGAALQAGFAHARGGLLAFLDADGTCDPAGLADLCRALDEHRADIVLGSRMGQGNEMPLTRRVGNTAFAWLLGILAKHRVHDTASGMRVLRRAAYEQLLPLPAGMNFTPAMSARALLEGRLELIEVPIAYAERIGTSKLAVVADGLRFLRSILQAALVYRPARLLLLAAGAMIVAALACGALPVRAYLAAGRLEEWMIYRILLASLLATLGGLGLSAAVLSERIAAASHRRDFVRSGVTSWIARLYAWPLNGLICLALGGCAAALVASGFAEFLARGTVSIHWSRPLLASLLLVLLAAHALTTLLLGMVDLMERQAGRGAVPARPDRLRRAEDVA